MSKKYKLPKSWTTVTPFSKYLALSMFVLVPIFAFYLGIYYEKHTRQGFPNFFCKQWDTICDPNVVDDHGKCAYKTICLDNITPTPTPAMPENN